MQAFHCPIDTSLSFVQANKLIRELNPAHVVVSRQYTVPPTSFSQRQDLIVDCVSMNITLTTILVVCFAFSSAFDLVSAFISDFSSVRN